MDPLRPVRGARAATASVTLAAVFLTGCVTWRAENTPYVDSLSGKTVRVARVTRTGEQPPGLELYHVAVAADSVVGDTARDKPWSRIAIPLADVERIDTPHTATDKTVLLLFGIAAGAVLLAVLACGGGSCLDLSGSGWGSFY